jgi:hypothetical protein
MKLADFGFNVYSQAGEDGIIQKIFEIIQPQSRICIEFGATDGIYMSNTAHLWQNGWKAILIEASDKHLAKLQANTQNYDCVCLHEFVTPTGENALENILNRNNITQPIDLLSIDIDGNDYYIFQGLYEIRPRVVIVEYNPTIPIHIDLVATEDNYFGTSARALINLAESKKYRLVAITKTNCIFVTEEEFPKFADFETSPEQLAVNDNLVFLITGFDGKYVLSKNPPFGMKNIYKQSLIGDYHLPPEPEVREMGTLALIQKKLRRFLKR